jgi:hypothetical protein
MHNQHAGTKVLIEIRQCDRVNTHARKGGRVPRGRDHPRAPGEQSPRNVPAGESASKNQDLERHFGQISEGKSSTA